MLSGVLAEAKAVNLTLLLNVISMKKLSMVQKISWDIKMSKM